MQLRIDAMDRDFMRKYEVENDAKIALMNYVNSLGEDHVIACAKYMYESANGDLTVFKSGTEFWHDNYVDLSVLNDLGPNGVIYFDPWTDEELKSEIK